jgi:hypothetical protein
VLWKRTRFFVHARAAHSLSASDELRFRIPFGVVPLSISPINVQANQLSFAIENYLIFSFQSMPRPTKKSARSKTKTIHLRKSWTKSKPSMRQRKEMLKTCGPKCFLDPYHKPNPAYPVCVFDRRGKCRVSEKGALAAYKRAAQQHRPKLAAEGKALWTRLKKQK